MTIPDYEKLLKDHDWTYQMSEDSSVYRAGSSKASTIQRHKNDSPPHQKLYLKYYKFMEII